MLCASGPAMADWVTLRDGRREQCIVLEQNDQWLRLERKAGRLSLPVSEVRSVERQDPADNAVLQAVYSLDQSGRDPAEIAKAAAQFTEALEAGASPSMVATAVLGLLDVSPQAPQMSSAAGQSLAGLLAKLAATKEAGLDDEQSLTASLFLARMGHTDEAIRLFLDAPEAAHQKYPEWQRELSAKVAEDVKEQIALDQTETAIERLTLLGRIDPERGQVSRPWTMMTRADLLCEAGKFRDAISLYATEVGVEYPEIAKNRVISAITDAKERARDSGNFGEVVSLTTGPVPQLFGQGPAERLRAQVYRDWGLAALDGREYDTAREALKQHYVLAPDDGQKLLRLVEYRQRADKIKAGSAEEHYNLAVFCLDAGLTEQAREQLTIASQDAVWGPLAQKHLDDLDAQRLEARLAHALELKDKGEYMEAREEVAQVLQEARDPELRQLAQRSLDIITKSMEYIHKRTPLEAEVLWQQAERCILPAESQRCLELLNEILRNYPQTPAAKKAAERRKKLLDSGFTDTARRTPYHTPQASVPTLVEEEAPFVDAERLQQEMQRLQESLQVVAGP